MYFKPPTVNLRERLARAWPCESPDLRSAKPTGARKLGVDYERACHEENQRRWGDEYIRSPWFAYTLRGSQQVRYCQPDSLLLLPERRVLLFEYKLHHCQDAFLQMHTLYIPVLEMYYGSGVRFSQMEVVKHFDPATPISFNYKYAGMLDEFDPAGVEPGKTYVALHRP